ncbi:hypothetical protein LSTR_LSTR016664, partial [Laodelphax striatellus]
AMAGPKSDRKRHKSGKSRKSRERPLRIEVARPAISLVQPSPVVVQQGRPAYPYVTPTYDSRPIAYTGDNRGYYDANGVFVTPGYAGNGAPVVVYPNGNQYASPQYVQNPQYGNPQYVQQGPQYGPQGPQYGPSQPQLVY